LSAWEAAGEGCRPRHELTEDGREVMFPFLDFGAVAFVLFAGFGLGVLLGWALKDRESKSSFDGDGGEPIVWEQWLEAGGGRGGDGEIADVIPLRRSRKAV
jgi:hypothetical protein